MLLASLLLTAEVSHKSTPASSHTLGESVLHLSLAPSLNRCEELGYLAHLRLLLSLYWPWIWKSPLIYNCPKLFLDSVNYPILFDIAGATLTRTQRNRIKGRTTSLSSYYLSQAYPKEFN